jgi:hypothetical protein
MSARDGSGSTTTRRHDEYRADSIIGKAAPDWLREDNDRLPF